MKPLFFLAHLIDIRAPGMETEVTAACKIRSALKSLNDLFEIEKIDGWLLKKRQSTAHLNSNCFITCECLCLFWAIERMTIKRQ